MAPIRILLKYFYHESCPSCFNKNQPSQLKYYSYLAERFLTPQAITVYPDFELVHVYVERGIHPMDSIFWHHIENTLVELMQKETNNGQLEPRRLYLKKKNQVRLSPIDFRLVGTELVINGVYSLQDFVSEQQRMFLNTFYFYAPFEPPRCELRIVYLDTDYETDLKLMSVEPESTALHEKIFKTIDSLCGTFGKHPEYDTALAEATSLLLEVPFFIGVFQLFFKPLVQYYPEFVSIPKFQDTTKEDEEKDIHKKQLELLIPPNTKKQQILSDCQYRVATPCRILELGLLKEGVFTTIKNAPKPVNCDDEDDDLLNVLRKQERGRERNPDPRSEFLTLVERESEVKDFFDQPIQASGDEDFLIILTKKPDEPELILEIFQNIKNNGDTNNGNTKFKRLELLRRSCAPLFEC